MLAEQLTLKYNVMNKHILFTKINNVKNTMFWGDFIKENPQMIKPIEKSKDFKYLNTKDLENSIKKLKLFDMNLLWDKKYMGLKIGDSISAVACEPYNFLKGL